MDLPLPELSRPAAETAPDPAGPPFVLHLPARQTAPLVFVSAHSGAVYPADFLAGSRLDPLALRRSADSFVDELFGAAREHGAPLLAATFPRAYCDANREKWELDPAMFDGALPDWVNTTSPRVLAGLGTLARVVASGEAIYRGKLPFAEAVRRAETCWQPFHDALADLAAATRARFGACLIVDCHSMPAFGAGRQPAADIVLGDAHGTSCASTVARLLERRLAELGFAVRRNDPYAGGFITRHHGRPATGIHAIQIEVARALYMDEARVEKRAGFARLQGRLAHLIEHLAGEALGAMPRPVAAER